MLQTITAQLRPVCSRQDLCDTSPALQVLSNMVDFGMEPQAALDAPRFRLEGVDSAVGPASVRTSKCALM